WGRGGSGRVPVTGADLVRRRTVGDRNGGWVPRLRIQHAAGALTLGGELRFADGRHYGAVIAGDGLPPTTPPDATYYDFRPRTLAAGLFAREEWQGRPRLQATAHLAWRHEGAALRAGPLDRIPLHP